MACNVGPPVPAYMAPPDYVAPVNLARQVVSISVNDFGTLASAEGADALSPSFLHWRVVVNGPGLEDDEYAFFQHNATIAVGDNIWETTDFAIGGDAN